MTQFPYRTHFEVLRKASKHRSLKDAISIFEEGDAVQADKEAVIGGLTYIANWAYDCNEMNICKRARGIREYIRNGG